MTHLYGKDEFLSDEFQRNQVVYADDLAMVIVPKQAYVENYVMIAPTKQVEFFDQITPETLGAMWALVEMLDFVLTKHVKNYSGYTLMINRGISAGQKVPHVHIHYFPHMRGEVEHPLYTQIKPNAHKNTDPGIEIRYTSIQKLLADGPRNEQVLKKTAVTFNTLPGTHPAQILIHCMGASRPHQMGSTALRQLLNLLQTMVAKDNTYARGTKGYNIIFPQQNYVYTPIDGVGFEISLITRSLDEAESPLKRLALKNTEK